MENFASLPSLALPRGNEKMWAVVCHLSVISVALGLVLPLAVYLCYRHESAYTAHHAREALNFHLSLLLYCLCCVPLVFLFGLGAILIIIAALGSLILGIVAAVKSSDGQLYRYPLTIRFIS
jgi:uncharacterized Tic20 family protein